MVRPVLSLADMPNATQSGLSRMLAKSPAEESMLASFDFSAPLAETEGANSAHPIGTPPAWEPSFLAVPHSGNNGLPGSDSGMYSGTPTEQDAHFAMGRLSGRANLDDVPESAGGLPGHRTPSPQRSPILGTAGTGTKALPIDLPAAKA